MKILHIIGNLSGGGAETLLVNLLRLNESSNHLFDVLILNKKKENSLIYNNSKFQIYTSPYGIRSIVNIFFISKLVNQNKYDIIHSHLFPSLYFSPLTFHFLLELIFEHPYKR